MNLLHIFAPIRARDEEIRRLQNELTSARLDAMLAQEELRKLKARIERVTVMTKIEKDRVTCIGIARARRDALAENTRKLAHFMEEHMELSKGQHSESWKENAHYFRSEWLILKPEKGARE